MPHTEIKTHMNFIFGPAAVADAMARSIIGWIWTDAMEAMGRDATVAPDWLFEVESIARAGQAEAWRLLGLYEYANGDMARLQARLASDIENAGAEATPVFAGNALASHAYFKDTAILETVKVPRWSLILDLEAMIAPYAATCDMRSLRQGQIIAAGTEGRADVLIYVQGWNEEYILGYVVNGLYDVYLSFDGRVISGQANSGKADHVPMSVVYTGPIESMPDPASIPVDLQMIEALYVDETLQGRILDEIEGHLAAKRIDNLAPVSL